MMAPSEYVTVATINAPVARVWAILTDAAGYATWNPEIISIDGTFAAGARFAARVKLGNGAVRSVSMTVTRLDPESRMEWTGGMPLGLFVGRRTFTVTPRDRRTEFRMNLEMTGLLAPLIIRSVGDRQREIDSFSSALKAHAEAT
jgi:uncharacterized protein YndB with AHSA1/START domain